MTTREILQKTKAAWGCIRSAGAEEKNRLLLSMAESLLQHADTILYENAHDLEQARGLISEVMLDRLRLSADRLEGMASGIMSITVTSLPAASILAASRPVWPAPRTTTFLPVISGF